jgi:hypothetical protein
MPPDEFASFKKGFLLGKPPDSRPQRSSEPIRTQDAPETQAERVEDNSILHYIQHLRGQYGPSPGEDALPLPYDEASELFDRVEAWARQTRVLNACERVEKAVKIIEEAAKNLQDKPASYAQAARAGGAAQETVLNIPQKLHPKEEKRVTIKIPNKSEAEEIRHQAKEDIVARIQQSAGGQHAAHTVLAVRQLRSGDLVVHMDSLTGKKEMERQQSWIGAICPSAVVRKRTWPVIIHGVKMEKYPLDAWEKHARSIEKENIKLSPDLRIQGMRWLRRTNKKEYAPLVIEVNSAEQANRLVNEGVVMGCDLKIVKRYDTSCRITQCFKCQKYGHISSVCSNKEKCGHCGGDHKTETCAGMSPAPRKRCAACHGGNHTSWSAECPARVKEILRAKAARQTLSTLFPISATLREACDTQGENTPDGEWSTVTVKKRKVGRPVGAVNKTKTINRDASQSIFSFSSQSMRGTCETPATTQLDKHSQMDCDNTQTG